MEKNQYILTDGKKYIKFNELCEPIITNKRELANVFESLLSANNYLQNGKMQKINREVGKYKFNIKPVEDFPAINNNNVFSNEIMTEIIKLDSALNDFADIKMSDNDNQHIYSGKTFIENNDFNFVYFIKTAIKVFSQLDVFIENMAYLERETDLKISDIRHYKRDNDTKLNAIAAQKLEYYEQELERERIRYKKNRIIGSIIFKDLNRVKNSYYIKIIENIESSEYKYRRLDKDQISNIIDVKRKIKFIAV